MSDFDRFDDFSQPEDRRAQANLGRTPQRRSADSGQHSSDRTQRIERQRYDGPRQADRNQYWSTRNNERAASRQASRTSQFQRISRDCDDAYDERATSSERGAGRERGGQSAQPRAAQRRPASQRQAGARDAAPRPPRSGAGRGTATNGDRYLSSFPMPSRRKWVVAAIAAIAILLVAGIAFGVTHIGKEDGQANSQQQAGQLEANDKMQADAPAEPTSITVAAVGDMIFGRNVGDLIDEQGGTAPLANVASILAANDVTIGNLESPLADGGDAQEWKDVILIGRPAAIEGLKACDFTFLSLANNHMLDYGEPALVDTLATLDEAGIGHAGAGMNESEAWAAATAEVEGKTFAFLSFSDILPDGFVASETKPGIAAARLDMDAVCTVIRAYKQSHDYVFVSFHWGVEYEDYANDDQIREAHQAVDAGADAIFSEHPHVIQGVEFYNGALIAYSLGDFVFDHYSRKTGESFILELELTDNGIENVKATPTYLDEYGAPSVVAGDEATVILDRLNEISSGMNMTMEQRGSVGYLHATDAGSAA